jgi:hypothetical protein
MKYTSKRPANFIPVVSVICAFIVAAYLLRSVATIVQSVSLSLSLSLCNRATNDASRRRGFDRRGHRIGIELKFQRVGELCTRTWE